MVLKLKKKKSPTNIDEANKRYAEIVEDKAVRGIDPDASELTALGYFMGERSIEEFRSDVKRRRACRDALQQLADLEESQPEIEALRDRIGRMQGELDTLGAEHYERECFTIQDR